MNRFVVAVAWLLASTVTFAGCAPNAGQDKQPDSSAVAQGKTDAGDKAGKKKSEADTGKTPSPNAKRPDGPLSRKSKVKSNEEVRRICEALAADDLADKDREALLDRLEKLHPELFPHVVTLIVERPKAVFALEGIAKLGTKGNDAMPLLIKEWNSAEKAHAKGGANALYDGGVAGGALVFVAHTLAKVAPDDTRVMELLIRGTALSGFAQPPAADGLGQSWPFSNRLFSFYGLLAQMARDDDEAIQYLMPTFVAGVGDKDDSVKLAVIRILGEFGPAAKGAIETLRPLRFNENTEIRDAAQAALKKIDVK